LAEFGGECDTVGGHLSLAHLTPGGRQPIRQFGRLRVARTNELVLGARPVDVIRDEQAARDDLGDPRRTKWIRTDPRPDQSWIFI
jgi:hypothetical protein